ncbi:fructokinase [Evansella vedderi]|uniref:Fructokinase n=1 Tax=Evansella vedderi TaxID=38282 RepID=A0ABU0A1Q6_9BACI|nr:aminoimidazole riboside kinase [Evansella vedderi]MDQ0257421.1 fructokinase [Evansella vedderi]
MKKGVISLGEALIDFIPLDENNFNYQKSPGGAPANVAVGLGRLGVKTCFLGKVGKDVLGGFLKETLESYNVDTTYMYETEEVRTGFVFVTLGEGGERSFEFYINPSADRFLDSEEVQNVPFQDYRVLHFGSISLIGEPSRSATKKAVELAKQNGLIVSYDPNLRLDLWENEQKAKETIISMLTEADVLKISEEELEFLTGEKDVIQGVEKLTNYNIPVTIVTLGAEGSYVFLKEGYVKVSPMKVEAVDTTGAGDAYVSGILYHLQALEKNLGELTLKEVEEIAHFAAVSGGLAASKKGAMSALPTLEEVKKLL